MDQKAFPRYFVYGTGYTPPALYIRVANEHAAQIVDPSGLSMNAHGGIEYWLHRVQEGVMVELTREALVEQIERWNEVNVPKLKLPD
jgi:hypothetical protein